MWDTELTTIRNQAQGLLQENATLDEHQRQLDARRNEIGVELLRLQGEERFVLRIQQSEDKTAKPLTLVSGEGEAEIANG